MLKAADALCADHGGILPLRCVTHTMNLVSNEITSESGTHNVIDKLVNAKIVSGYCVTRWNSFYDSMKQASQTSIAAQVLEHTTHEGLKNLVNWEGILRPFAVFVDVSQSDWATVFDVTRELYKVRAHLASHDKRYTWVKAASAHFDDRLIRQFMSPAVVAGIALLPDIPWMTLDSRMKKLLTDAVTKVALAVAIAKGWAQDIFVQGVAGEYASWVVLQKRFGLHEEFAMLSRPFERIKEIYNCLVNIAVSEAPVERVFSAVKRIADDERSRLAPTKVSDLTFIKMNDENVNKGRSVERPAKADNSTLSWPQACELMNVLLSQVHHDEIKLCPKATLSLALVFPEHPGEAKHYFAEMRSQVEGSNTFKFLIHSRREVVTVDLNTVEWQCLQ